ncbi:odorant receptor 23a-like [Drosophila takahashii]|uniref:odorant receptor 23a-like n=1 Tax=Drosophila takahashii TaxID=29030 RepID=UPI001CF8FA44|nr:odorant receptor 23a-like [Drosophila takahashii]
MKLSKSLRQDYFRDQLLAWRIGGAIELAEGKFWSWAMALNICAYLQIPMFMKAMFSFDDPMENNFNLFLTITSVANLVKLTMYVSQLTKVVDIQRTIAKLDARVSGDDQVLRHRKMCNHLQRMSKIFLATFVIIFINASVSFAFESERSLSMPMWIPFDWKNSMTAYIGALVFQTFGIFIQILQNFAGDSFAALALFLVCEQCQLLTLRISSIGYGSNTLKENEQDLVDCIEDQNTLYRLLDLVHSLTSYPVIVQFLVIGIDIAVTSFALIFYVQTLSERIFYMSLLVGLTLQIYPLCYYGTRVEESFAELHYAVFCSNWVDQSATYRGFMLIIEERTKRRQVLLAGNLVPIHLSTFVACWKGAYSFFTLMAHRSGHTSN